MPPAAALTDHLVHHRAAQVGAEIVDVVLAPSGPHTRDGLGDDVLGRRLIAGDDVGEAQ